MRSTTLGTALFVLASPALAGGLDASRQQIGVLFEEGDRLETTLAFVSPSASGTLGVDSGDILSGYPIGSLGYKRDLSPQLSFGLVIDQPYRGETDYPTGTGYPFAGSTASVDSLAVTALGRYKVGNGFAIHAGVKAQRIGAKVAVPPAGGYTLDSNDAWGHGFVAGASYEIPDIALRAALTYHSSVDHTLTVDESSVLGANTSDIDFEIPQSIELDFRTGVNPKTLVFANVRWVEWSSFRATPPDYQTLTGTSLLRYLEDRTTYTLGAARRIDDDWAVIGSVAYEPSVDEITTDLGPVDGRTSVSLAARYTMDDTELTFGASYFWLGDATTRNGASFTDNSAMTFGVKLGIKL